MENRNKLEKELFDITKKHNNWEILIENISDNELKKVIEDMKEYNKEMYNEYEEE